MIEIGDHEINIVNIYAPRTDTERKTFYSELDKYISTEHNNIIAGDTNLALTQYDRMEGSMPARQTARTELYRLITKHDLTDIWRQRNPNKREFTWTSSDSTTHRTIRTRIDRIPITQNLDQNVSKTQIIPYQHSDHDSTTLEKRRQAEQSIKILTKDNNETCTLQQDIIKEVHSYYKSLYTAEPTDPTAQDQILNIDTPTLTDEARESCEGLITAAELKKALDEMELNKSPGLDGLTSNFYKYFWNILGNTLTIVYNYAFEHEPLSVSQRRGVITLIFKKNDRTKLKNWRPVTLLTTDYKILTKALANRLKNVLPMIIHTDQTACVKGRTINDNVSGLIRDAIYYANETNKKLAIITIDG